MTEIRFIGSTGDPVRPVSEYCEAFRLWQTAISEAIDRGDFDAAEGYEGDTTYWVNQRKKWEEVRDALNVLRLPIAKSALLLRLIYGDESQLRTKKCPKHNGHWVGCAWDQDQCECVDNHGNITGWLPEGE